MKNNTVSMKSTLQNAWDKAEAVYLANPTSENYRILHEKAKAYEWGWMLFGNTAKWLEPEEEKYYK